jgi:hypothetical protein
MDCERRPGLAQLTAGLAKRTYGGLHRICKDVVICIEEIDRMMFANCGSHVRSHPPVLHALAALRAQEYAS